MRISDWSSDVCSSDLQHGEPQPGGNLADQRRIGAAEDVAHEQQCADRRHCCGDEHHRVAPQLARVELDEGLADRRSEEHTSELQSLMRISYAVFCLKKKIETDENQPTETK